MNRQKSSFLFTIPYWNHPTMTERAAVFVHYDRDDIVDAYVYTYLNALRSVCSKIIFV